MPQQRGDHYRRTPLYKTQLCRNFMDGECHRGEDCHYAHGQQDLRQSQQQYEHASAHPNKVSDARHRTMITRHYKNIQAESAHGHRNSEQPTDEGGVFRARHPHLLKFSAAVAQVQFERMSDNETANAGDMEQLTGTQFELDRTKGGPYILRFKALERDMQYRTARVDKLSRVFEEDCSAGWEQMLATTTTDVSKLQDLCADIICLIKGAPEGFKRLPPYLQPHLTKYKRTRAPSAGQPPAHLQAPAPGVVAPSYGLQDMAGATGGGVLSVGVVAPHDATQPDVRNPFAALTLSDDDNDETPSEEGEPPRPARNFRFIDFDAPIATTGQLRYFDCLVACALAEAYQFKALEYKKERKWKEMAETFVVAFDTVNNLFLREECNRMVAIHMQADAGDIRPEELDGHCVALLAKVVQNITLVRDHLADAKDKAVQKCLTEQAKIYDRLNPQLRDRDSAKMKFEQRGQKWTENPAPKNDFAQRRKALEIEARQLALALELLAGLQFN